MKPLVTNRARSRGEMRAMKGRLERDRGRERTGRKQGKVGWRMEGSVEDNPIASLVFLSHLQNDL